MSVGWRRGFGSVSLGILVSGVESIPHPEKKHKGGEDAFFVKPNGVGVFDGVGGWATQGVDPKDYSNALAKGCSDFLDDNGVDASKSDVRLMLQYAYDQTKGPPLLMGSSTACVGLVHKYTDGTAHDVGEEKMMVLNVGDSACLVFSSEGKLENMTNTQQHYFNCPFQLGAASGSDSPSVADLYLVPLSKQRILLFATDGVLDNVFPNEIEEIVATTLKEHKGEPLQEVMQLVSANVARQASEFAHNETKVTPWSESVGDTGGGKVDDIMVVCTTYVGEQVKAKL